MDKSLDDTIGVRLGGNYNNARRGNWRGRVGYQRLSISTGKKFGAKNFGSGIVNVSDLRDKLGSTPDQVQDLRQKINTPHHLGSQQATKTLHSDLVQQQSRLDNKESFGRRSGQQERQSSRVTVKQGILGGRSETQATFDHPVRSMNTSRSRSPFQNAFRVPRDEMKKIQVTVPGRNRPVEPSSRPATSHQRRRDEPSGHHTSFSHEQHTSRHKTEEQFLRQRHDGDQFVKRALSSVLRSQPSYHHSSEVRSRSPSPFEAALEDYRYHREMVKYGNGSSALSQYPRGLQTGTCLVISNLNATVSKGDVIELCQAIGALEMVKITSPGVAEIVFVNKEDAMEAYKKYHHRNLDGQPMICKLQMASTQYHDGMATRDSYSSRYGRSSGGYVDYDREDYLTQGDYGHF